MLVMQEAREAVLAAKKVEHLREEALLALEVARGELAASQLVVDEGSEAARLREQVRIRVLCRGLMFRKSSGMH